MKVQPGFLSRWLPPRVYLFALLTLPSSYLQNPLRIDFGFSPEASLLSFFGSQFIHVVSLLQMKHCWVFRLQSIPHHSIDPSRYLMLE
mmetsp:Transcript_37451/g.112317  ORF Transcript_37451/g.112317 Transcript_37451/m.112317 type:complete len:88 (-) Transcript_37451:546-809(-)